MGDSTLLRQEDRVGLVISLALHAGLVALLLLPKGRSEPFEIPERVSVSLVSEVSLEATAPQIAPESRAALAPQLDDTLGPVIEESPDAIAPEPELPSPVATRSIDARAAQQPKPEREPPRKQTEPKKEAATAGGGQLVGDDFLNGLGESTETQNKSSPASTIGDREKAALKQAIDRQLKPHWQAPNGEDAEKLVSLVSWRMNEDGSLRGDVRCTTIQSTVTRYNRPQAALHCKRAIQAVRDAAPFKLPARFYDDWKTITNWSLSKRSVL